MRLFFVVFAFLFLASQGRADAEKAISPRAWELRVNHATGDLEPLLSHYLSLARAPYPTGQAALIAQKCGVSLSMIDAGFEGVLDFFKKQTKPRSFSWDRQAMIEYLGPNFDAIVEQLPAASASLYYMNEIVRYTAEYLTLLQTRDEASAEEAALKYSTASPMGTDARDYWKWEAPVWIEDRELANHLTRLPKIPAGIVDVVREYRTAIGEKKMPSHPSFRRFFAAVVGLSHPTRLREILHWLHSR